MCLVSSKKRKPVQEKPAEKNDKCSFENFSQYFRLSQHGPLIHGKTHCVTDCKHKRREHQVSWCESMPMGMLERRISEFASGCIYNDHKTDRHTSEYIQGQKTLFWCKRHVENFTIGWGLQVRKLYPMVKERSLISFLKFPFY